MRHSRKLFLGASGLMAGALSLALGTGVAWASGSGGSGTGGSDRPPGNNGTVKVDEFSTDPGQDNDPHVSCGFSVNFYGYDGGPQTATIYVTPVAPTAGGHTYSTSTSWDVGTRTGGDQFDRSVSVTGADLASALSGVTPQTQQGYHLRLEVEVPGSPAAPSDDKYKVFWMAPCATSPGASPAAVPASTTTSTTPSTTTTTLAPKQVATPDVPSTTSTTAARVSAAASPRTSPSSGVVASSVTQSPASPAVSPMAGQGDSGQVDSTAVPVATASVSRASRAGGFLAFTGVYVAALAAVGLALIAAGTLLTLRWRRSPA